ncbi:MAG: patatin-like phospholipase family protein [Marinifilaceae bacterium]
MNQQLGFIVLIFLLTLFPVRAQKVGLVLSGGGAKGMAHIGLIRALEENNIPIDCIAGTSIGAIVGGLYAIGYTPNQLESLFTSEEFNNWVQGKMENKYYYYFKKPDPNATQFRLKFKKKGKGYKLKIPTNLIPTFQIDFQFLKLYASASAAANNNFDSLYIPFRCVATDIFKNEQVVFRKGDLGAAIRASSTFPLVYRPIAIDSVVLFDGGLVNNFPVDVLLEDFKPDFIIGNQVAHNFDKPNLDDIESQLGNMLTRETKYEIPDSLGILIETKFTNINLLDFKKYNQIAQKGYDRAMEYMDQIKERISRRILYAELQKKRMAFRSKIPQVQIDEVETQGVNKIQNLYFLKSLTKDNKGKYPQPVSLEEFKKSYFKLIADEHIETIFPRATYNPKKKLFNLNLHIKPESQIEIQLGGNISSQSVNQAYGGFRYNTVTRHAFTYSGNFYFGRLYNSLHLGARMYHADNLPYYLEAFFTQNRWDYFKGSSGVFFENELRTFAIEKEINLRINFGIPVHTNGKFEIGLAVADMQNRFSPTLDFRENGQLSTTKYDILTAHLMMERKTYNYLQHPTMGSHKKIQIRGISAYQKDLKPVLPNGGTPYRHNHKWIEIKGVYDNYFKLNSLFRVGVHASGLYSNRKLQPQFMSTVMAAPAFQPTPHSKTLFMPKFRANQYLASGLKFLFHLSSSLHLRSENYYFSPYQRIYQEENLQPAYGKKGFKDFYFHSMNALVFHSRFGPASISLNYYEKEGTKFFFLFNFGYILFNKRGID